MLLPQVSADVGVLTSQSHAALKPTCVHTCVCPWQVWMHQVSMDVSALSLHSHTAFNPPVYIHVYPWQVWMHQVSVDVSAQSSHSHTAFNPPVYIRVSLAGMSASGQHGCQCPVITFTYSVNPPVYIHVCVPSRYECIKSVWMSMPCHHIHIQRLTHLCTYMCVSLAGMNASSQRGCQCPVIPCTCSV